MKFTKMHGIGNDYVYVNGFEEELPIEAGRLAELVSDRHFGIGSDGLILIKPSQIADFTMEMYNSDGTRGLMCGNGIRCVAKYVYDHGMTNKTTLHIETGAGIKKLDLKVKNSKVVQVTVDMGIPTLIGEEGETPLTPGVAGTLKAEEIWRELPFKDHPQTVIPISMGNPHAILFVPDVTDIPITTIGPRIENHPFFADRTNVEFVHVTGNDSIRMRVWERGAGETMACGTGACASAVASALIGQTGHSVDVRLNGGSLHIKWREDGHVEMTGTATEVFTGEFFI
ncbi:MAG: diaminopimelate epimerase [Lachnospiraceae bacterium]|nr:diaminopimelate epimerase [Lachnospiraceae bacterium]